MKAQASVEFLLNFLLLLVLISALLASLADMRSSASEFAYAAREKAEAENVARTLDISQCMRYERFYLGGNYSLSEIGSAGAIREQDGNTLAYTIYGMGETDGEAA